METIKKGLDQLLKWVSVILFAALVIIVAWQVITRTAGDASTWAEEGARYSFVWLAFFASALVFSEKGHIAVDFLVRRQPLARQKVTAVIAQVAIMALAVLVFIWGGIRAANRSWGQQLSSLPGTVGYMYTVLPITGVLVLFYAIYHTLQIIRNEQPPYVDDVDSVVTPNHPEEHVSDPDDAQAPKRPQENL